MEMKTFLEDLKKIVKRNPKGRAYDEKGQFYPDPTPVAPPIGYVPEVSMFDRVRDMVRREMSKAADEQGFETFEEADDFDVDDDAELKSPYELVFQPEPDGPKYPEPEKDPVPSPKPPEPAEGGEGGGHKEPPPKPPEKPGKA